MRTLTKLIAFVALLAVAPACAQEADLSAVSSPKVDLAAVKEFGTVSAVDGVTAAGQPDAEALEIFADSGYAAVIDLRGVGEDRGFDQAAEVEALGMDYVTLPVVGRDGISFENARKLDEILAQYDAPVLVHCGSSNRVGALFALNASLAGADVEQAIEVGKSRGLTRLEGIVREELAEAESSE